MKIIIFYILIIFIGGTNAFGETIVPNSITFILFDSGDSISPSHKDSRWEVNNEEIKKLYSFLLNAKKWNSQIPVPECSTVACLEVVFQSTVKRFYIVHIHDKEARIISIRINGEQYTINNGKAFITCLKKLGIPTEKLYADSDNL
jgi:hypothetical protein